MMFIQLLYQAFIYGCIGLLLECFFTGIYSLYRGDTRMECKTWLFMHPVYAATAMILQAVSSSLVWPFYLKIFIYLPIIFGAEALSGWLSIKLYGRILWDYGRSKWTPFGVINLKYTPAWLVAGSIFELARHFMQH